MPALSPGIFTTHQSTFNFVFQFDYRVLHRGTANRTEEPRPVYVLTFGKSWYKDTLNYPHRSVFGKHKHGAELSIESANNLKEDLAKSEEQDDLNAEAAKVSLNEEQES